MAERHERVQPITTLADVRKLAFLAACLSHLLKPKNVPEVTSGAFHLSMALAFGVLQCLAQALCVALEALPDRRRTNAHGRRFDLRGLVYKLLPFRKSVLCVSSFRNP